jgi:hypothetical protein
LSGTALDRDGRPLAGLEILLAWGQAPDGSVPVLAQTSTDPQGQYEIKARA